MALETKDLLTYLGIDEKTADIEAFKTQFTKKFDTYDNLFNSEPFREKKSAINGAFVNIVRKYAAANGVEIPEAEIKGEDGKLKDNEFIVNHAFSKLHALSKQAIESGTAAMKTELETVKTKGIKEFEEKNSLLSSKVKDLEEINLKQKQEFENKEGGFNKQVKQIKLQTKKDSRYGSFEFKEKITPLEKAGFISLFESKYNIDLDENGNEYVTDKAGKHIADPSAHGATKTPDQVMKELAIENNVFKLNPDGGKGAGAVGGNGGMFSNFGKDKTPPAGADKPTVVIADRARV